MSEGNTYTQRRLARMDKFFERQFKVLGIRTGTDEFVSLSQIYRIGRRKRKLVGPYRYSATVSVNNSDIRLVWRVVRGELIITVVSTSLLFSLPSNS